MSELTLSSIAEYLGAQLRGEANLVITGINTLQNAQAGQISFLANPAYKKYLAATNASAVIMSEADAADFSGNVLVLANPYAAYARLTELFATATTQAAVIHPSAVIADDCHIGKDVAIGPNAVVESGVHIGDGSNIGCGVFIGRDSRLGKGVTLYPNVTVYHASNIGDDCIFHSGVVIGADGFGFAPDNSEWVKIHQLGAVMVGNNVELGANTCIDRGALGNTVIGDGVKIDNLVQIGHNCTIGRDTVISGCAAIAGSVAMGNRCMIGGAVAIAGHISIADDVVITGMTLITGSIQQAGSYSSGTRSAETRRWRKNAVRFNQLDELHARVKQLEKQRNLKD